MKLLGIYIAAIFVALSAPANAKPDPGVRVVQSGPWTLQADRAYILFRINESARVGKTMPVFLRIPSASEMSDYAVAKREAFERDLPKLSKNKILPEIEDYKFNYDKIANIYSIGDSQFFENTGGDREYLMEAIPADYIIYGSSWGNGLIVCNCLGTVAFHAESGMITDIGTILMARPEIPSAIPELVSETGLGNSINGGYSPIAQAIRPAASKVMIPSQLAGLAYHPALLYAVGPFIDNSGALINRMAPVEGVLRYDGGKVVDVRSGHIVH